MSLNGEHAATLAIHDVVGDFTPRPILFGSFEKLYNVHFYICKFYDLATELPEPMDFCRKLATLHARSVSPNGKFGFHDVTFNGDLPQDNRYTDTWEECFRNGFTHMFSLNVMRGGPWKVFQSLQPAMVDKVIPRLLRPLESNGRSVKPCLVHGDLWCGNVAVDTATNLPLIYDPASFYAHNECTTPPPPFKPLHHANN